MRVLQTTENVCVGKKRKLHSNSYNYSEHESWGKNSTPAYSYTLHQKCYTMLQRHAIKYYGPTDQAYSVCLFLPL